MRDSVPILGLRAGRRGALAADDFEDMELLYPLYRLREEDIAVTVAGLDDHPVTGKKGHGPVPVDATVEQVAADDFDALVLDQGLTLVAGQRGQRRDRGCAVGQLCGSGAAPGRSWVS